MLVRRPSRADGAAIDAGGFDGDEEDAVVRRIAGEASGVHGVEIEAVNGWGDGCVHDVNATLAPFALPVVA